MLLDLARLDWAGRRSPCWPNLGFPKDASSAPSGMEREEMAELNLHTYLILGTFWREGERKEWKSELQYGSFKVKDVKAIRMWFMALASLSHWRSGSSSCFWWPWKNESFGDLCKIVQKCIQLWNMLDGFAQLKPPSFRGVWFFSARWAVGRQLPKPDTSKAKSI